jgi:hypothetical protein
MSPEEAKAQEDGILHLLMEEKPELVDLLVRVVDAELKADKKREAN